MSQIIDKIVTSKYPPATNVAWMDTSSGDPMLKVFRNGTWETVTAEEPDLSNYIQKSSTAGLVKNDGTIDTASKENQVSAEVITESSNIVCEVNKYYLCDNPLGTTTITLPTVSDSYCKSICLYFGTTSNPNITFAPASVALQDGLEFEADSRYEVNCLYNGMFWVVTAIKIASV